MDFQQKMIEYAKYGFSVRTSSNNGVEYYMVTLTFGTKWKVQMPIEYEEQKVMCAKVRDQNLNGKREREERRDRDGEREVERTSIQVL